MAERAEEARSSEVPTTSAGSAVDLRYMPALDGLRALAVAAVMAYHLDYTWAGGGFLGVDLFFVLSGFLITTLLVRRWGASGEAGLRGFWARRARRLLPAVLVLLLVLACYAWAGGPGLDRNGLRSDALATLFYYANWHSIFAHQSYFAAFQAPSPLKHTWSLAIEEQFYLFWPLIVAGLGVLVGRRVRAGRAKASFRRRGLAMSIVLALASAIAMALLYHPGKDPSLVYYGSDTRAFELLIGAALAFWMDGRRAPTGPRRWTLDAAGTLSAGVIIYAMVAISGTPGWLWRGGMFGGSLLAAVLIASLVQPRLGPLGLVLSLRPLRYIGRISYGLYLWHWPVFVLLTDTTTGLTGNWLLAARLGTTLGVATLSYYLIESPIRHGWPAGWRIRALAPAGVAATGAAIVLATAPLAASAAPVAPLAFSGAARAQGAAALGATSATSATGSGTGSLHPAASPDAESAEAITEPGTPTIVLPPGRVPSPSDPLRVMVIGDSVMADAEPGVAAALESTGAVKIINTAFPGWGLTNLEGWRTDWPGVIRRERPEVVIGTWSWDDDMAASDPVGYAQLLNQALGILLAPGDGVDGVAFIQFPRTGPRLSITDPARRALDVINREAGREAWNAVAAGEAQLWPGQVTFLPVASSLEVNGQYSAWLPTANGGWVRARKLDNAHVCAAGAAALGIAVVNAATPQLHLPPMAPGWLGGSWTRSSHYNDPPGSCPDDQPPPGYAASLGF